MFIIRIMAVEKIRFDYDKNDKLDLIGKLSTANYDLMVS